MKSFLIVQLILLLSRLDLYRSQRRIKGGQVVNSDKRYMAYLVKAPLSPQEYDTWLCGAAIVNNIFLVTSAACVEDIKYMYAIAGYNKYVPADKINDDPCTKNSRKKIVFTCTPKNYDFQYDKTEKWSNIDIAVVRVESPYDFNAPAPAEGCSWVPDMIEINYDSKYQSTGTDALVLGWGHTDIWRKADDTTDYNQEKLNYGSTQIQDKEECKQSYQNLPNLLPIIDKYMICTLKTGNIDGNGRQIMKAPPLFEGCGNTMSNTNCTDPNSVPVPPNPTSGPIGRSFDRPPEPSANNGPTYQFGTSRNLNFRRAVNISADNLTLEFGSARRTGICQNDHGGPLVTWVGSYEVLIGVASVFLVSGRDSKCVGPYLYTSTQCNGAFLCCVLSIFDNSTSDKTLRSVNYGRSPDIDKRREIFMRYQFRYQMAKKMCDMPPEERGFEMVQRRISWMHHPDGPAVNELDEDLIARPQIPLNKYRYFDKK